MTHEPLSEEELAELERVFATSTQGEWVAGYVSGRCTLDHGKGPGGHGGADCVYTAELCDDDISISVANFPTTVKRRASPAERGMISGTWAYEDGGIALKVDRDAIVAMHNAFPRLMATVRAEREAERERCAKIVDSLGNSLAESIQHAVGARQAFALARESEARIRGGE